MRVLILLLALTSSHAQAGSSEYWLLDATDCKRYTVSTDLGVYYDPDPVKYQNALAKYEQTIGALKAAHDDTWSAGWGVEAEGGERSFGVCKEEYDSSGNKLALFQCDGDALYPLPELRCKFGRGNRWYEKCTVKGKRNHDLRLYWVDTSEYELGGSSAVNKGYNRDIAKCKTTK